VGVAPPGEDGDVLHQRIAWGEDLVDRGDERGPYRTGSMKICRQSRKHLETELADVPRCRPPEPPPAGFVSA
jgi:hypothetical protein